MSAPAPAKLTKDMRRGVTVFVSVDSSMHPYAQWLLKNIHKIVPDAPFQQSGHDFVYVRVILYQDEAEWLQEKLTSGPMEDTTYWKAMKLSFKPEFAVLLGPCVQDDQLTTGKRLWEVWDKDGPM